MAFILPSIISRKCEISLNPQVDEKYSGVINGVSLDPLDDEAFGSISRGEGLGFVGMFDKIFPKMETVMSPENSVRILSQDAAGGGHYVLFVHSLWDQLQHM